MPTVTGFKSTALLPQPTFEFLTGHKQIIQHKCYVNQDSRCDRRSSGPALDAVPAMFTTYAYYNSDKFVFYGEELMKRSMAYRLFLDAGVQAAAGSDFSPGPFAPLMNIQGMVTRIGWDGKIQGANPCQFSPRSFPMPKRYRRSDLVFCDYTAKCPSISRKINDLNLELVFFGS